ncbi:hypothetical protein IE077_002484 [Cardiosporidium cionae]|uniref:Uncharacterized protein n=1 Tax=Cardiosporidium cionae TaxID=476202 RepID=A0ABQ7JAV5_9APIC|nr:hypothetical protein IE077_002484 [Cardiosporidium cionae]|eukprot:KAF8821085.1 hypothetical protein IE077_002484 [Cardiosporidium cionae]
MQKRYFLNEKVISSLFARSSKGAPPRIGLTEAVNTIIISEIVPLGVSRQEVIEEVYLRHLDKRFGFLSNLQQQDGGRKKSANPPGGVDLSKCWPSLNFEQFKYLLQVTALFFSISSALGSLDTRPVLAVSMALDVERKIISLDGSYVTGVQEYISSKLPSQLRNVSNPVIFMSFGIYQP